MTNLTTGGSVGTTGKIEWQYLGLNDFTVGPDVLGDALRVRSASVNTLTFGINDLFNWGGGGYATAGRGPILIAGNAVPPIRTASPQEALRP